MGGGGWWVTIPIIESNQLYWLRLSWVLTMMTSMESAAQFALAKTGEGDRNGMGCVGFG